jgi:hypothetical protein
MNVVIKWFIIQHQIIKTGVKINIYYALEGELIGWHLNNLEIGLPVLTRKV